MQESKPPTRAATDPQGTNQDLQTLSAPIISSPREAGSGCLSSPPPFKINIFHQQRKGVRLAMSNCREIQVTVLLPMDINTADSPFISDTSDFGCGFEKMDGFDNENKVGGGILADQLEQSAYLSPAIASHVQASHDDVHQILPQPGTTEESKPKAFPLLALPLELRLKIYAYLLPPRHHKIATQIPHSGYFYNTSTIPLHSATSFYPFGTNPPSSNPKLTTYKILSSNQHSSFPNPTIHTQLLLVNKQIYTEALPVLYGQKEVTFDFGTHLDAAQAFFSDRSAEARRVIKEIRIAREVPSWIGRDAWGQERVDEGWLRFCSFVRREMMGLRELDLVLWCSTGSAARFPTPVIDVTSVTSKEDDREKKIREEERQQKWREWEYTASLLNVEGLKQARVTWWGFNSIVNERGNGTGAGGVGFGWRVGGHEIAKEFDSWVAGRMVGDTLVRESMVREGRVVEGVVVVKGV